MQRPLYRFVFESFIAFGLLLVLGLFALTVRLDKGPLSLAPILPQLSGFVSDLAPGLNFQIGKAVLRHGKDRIVFEVDLRNVLVVNEQEKPIGNLEAMQ